jgi:hypothetical protein
VHGEAELHVGIRAKVGALVQGLTLGWSAEALGLLNEWVMPGPAAAKVEREKGVESESELTAGCLHN